MSKMIWFEELKKGRGVDVWEPASHDGTSTITYDPVCLQDIVTVEIPKHTFDRLIAIVEGAEWRGHDVDHPHAYSSWCPICGARESWEGDRIHKPTCLYSDSWDPPNE